MTTKIYLRPIGRLTRPPGRINPVPDRMLRIGDAEDVVFSAFELIERHANGWTGRRAVSADEARQLAGQPGPLGERLKVLMSRLQAKRHAIASLALDRKRTRSKPRVMRPGNVGRS